MSTIAEVKAGRANVKTVKSAYTAFIDQLRTKFNAGHVVSAADLTDLIVNQYDPVTFAMNDLAGKIDTLPDDPSLTLTDDQLASIDSNPGEYWQVTSAIQAVTLMRLSKDDWTAVVSKWSQDMLNLRDKFFAADGTTNSVSITQIEIAADLSIPALNEALWRALNPDAQPAP